MGPQKYTVVAVLGGGRGTRLFPLTRDRSKPAVPLGGKFRFIDIAISNSINSGLKRIFVLTQYNSASLNNHVAYTYKFDSFSKGFVTVLAAEQGYERNDGWFEGTADSVRKSLRYLSDPSFKNVLIIPGDHLCRIDLSEMMNLHEARGADVTLCAAIVGAKQAQRFRVLNVADDGRVQDFVRKPYESKVLARFRLHGDRWRSPNTDDPENSYLAFMGIYLFKKDVLFRLLLENDDRDLGRDLLPRILWTTRSYCYVFKGYWRDIGTIRAFYEASIDLTAENPKFRFQDPDAPIYTHGRYLPSTQIINSVLDGALAADGTVIRHSRIERSVIGVRARVEPNCHISHSIIFGADTFETPAQREASAEAGIPPIGIGPNCSIHKAIIDKNARIGESSCLENKGGVKEADGDNYYIRDGVIIIPSGGVIRPGAEL